MTSGVFARPVSWRVTGADVLSPGTSMPIRIDAVENLREKTYTYAIRWGDRTCFNKTGEWEYEPSQSMRAAAFLSRCRYVTFDLALSHLKTCVNLKMQRKSNV